VIYVSFPENVLKTALALYMYGDSVSLPLPTFEEVLVCNPATTTEEVSNTHSQTSFPDQRTTLIILRPYLPSFPDLNNFIPKSN